VADFDLKMKIICSSETSINFHQSTLRYITEDGTVQKLTSHNTKTLKSDTSVLLHLFA
jgi:hypothetical protein